VLLDRALGAAQARLADVARLGGIEGAAAMHRCLVVPHQQVVQPPRM
jgi:hypothetical protein